ncbi:MAG: P-II family nitrogen regulator [Firmicutes bacterium]|nr:P-II family nitrogen regulator [Bacillota bacterium]
MNYLAIVAIVERGKADDIVARAKKAGARGATILYGRGTGEHESRKFLKINIESSKEIIIIIADQNSYTPIYNLIVQAGNINQPGAGIIFTVPVANLMGVEHHKV